MEILNVIVAALAGFAYGALHYTTLSKPWMKAANIPMDENGKPVGGDRSPMPLVLSLIAMLIVAGFMRHIFAMSGITAPISGAISGLGVGLFFIAPWTMINNAYPGRPFMLTIIDGGYATIGCTIIGLVLTLF